MDELRARTVEHNQHGARTFEATVFLHARVNGTARPACLDEFTCIVTLPLATPLIRSGMLFFPFTAFVGAERWQNEISPSESCRCRARPIPEQNMERAIAHVRDAAKQGAELICLPELFQTQYFCQREDTALFELAEPIPGPATERLGELARELKITLIASLFERRAAGVYHNTAAILDPDGKLHGIYRKMHIPDDPLYYEKFYFTPGDLGFKTFEAEFGKFGTLVCWDQWYPEGARLTAAQGANVLFYPTAIGWHPDEKAQYGEAQYDAWRTIQRSHAIANGVYVAAVNRVGFETGNIRGNEAPGKGPGVLGRLVHRRSLRTGHRAGSARQRSDLARRSGPAPHRRCPPQLAVLARPPH